MRARASTQMGTASAESRVWPQPPAGFRAPRGKQPALRREGVLTWRTVLLAVRRLPSVGGQAASEGMRDGAWRLEFVC